MDNTVWQQPHSGVTKYHTDCINCSGNKIWSDQLQMVRVKTRVSGS